MNKKFGVDKTKSDTVSRKLSRLARLLQLKSPDAVIQQEIAALQREIATSDIVTISATVETRK